MSITIATNTTPTETTVISSKDISISCPQTAEQKDTEIVSKPTENSIQSVSKIEASEELDSDYNPNEEEEPSSEDVTADEESELEVSDGDQDEEKIVNSAEFQKELAEAIENVKKIAKIDRETILERAKQDYFDETGKEPTDKQMADALQTFSFSSKLTQQEIEEEEEESELEREKAEEEEFENEFAEALENVKELGQIHQEIFVEKVCETFLELNGEEPTIEELTNAFASIRYSFAEEAREEFIEINDGESDSDSDYQATNEDLQQIEKDNKICGRERVEIVFVESESDCDSDSDSSDESESESESEQESESQQESQDEAEISDDDDDDDVNDYDDYDDDDDDENKEDVTVDID